MREGTLKKAVNGKRDQGGALCKVWVMQAWAGRAGVHPVSPVWPLKESGEHEHGDGDVQVGISWPSPLTPIHPQTGEARPNASADFSSQRLPERRV